MMIFHKEELSRHVSPSEQRLSIRRQCELFGLSRSSYYYQPVGESQENLMLMDMIDRKHLQHPEWGYPRMNDYPVEELRMAINPKRTSRMMRKMRIRSVLPRPNTSKPNEAHKIYPYLLNRLNINTPRQVLATGITYIPMAKGFMYLTAVMDWYSRFVLSWQLSNSLEVAFCLDALESAWRHGNPGIFNTDQGAQFSSSAARTKAVFLDK